MDWLHCSVGLDHTCYNPSPFYKEMYEVIGT